MITKKIIKHFLLLEFKEILKYNLEIYKSKKLD